MADLDALLDQWMQEEVEQSPVSATSLGIDGHDHRLGDFSAAAFERRDQRAGYWRRTFADFTDEGLSLDQRIDRDLVLSTLRGREVMADWTAWRRDPAVYLGPCLSGVFLLFLHRLQADDELARSAAARLRAVPEVLAHAKTNLDAGLANRLIVERGLGQCRAGVGYARQMVPAEVHDDRLRSTLAEAGEVAAAAFEDLLPFLEDLATSAKGPYAIGEARYSGLLRHKELLTYGAEEMRERGRAAWEELDAEMADLAEQVGGSRDWRAVMEQVNAEHPATPEDMRAQYEDWTERARQFLVDRALVTLPEGERCLVEPSPPFQRPVLAVASYNSPPAFKPSLVGHFFVPYPPDGTSPEDVQKRLADNSTQGVPTTAVHEAYPGHHWHLTWMQQNPRPLRQFIRTPYFAEGWALYAERMMREEGFFTDPRQELCHLDARIFRAARIVVDTSLHIGDMTVDEAVEFMSTKATLTEPTARAEVGRYCAWPTQASSYLTGSLEIERIREQFFAQHRGDLRAFHDTLCGSGGLPIALAERAVLS
ncbi:MAG: hypothetical protein QOJ09_3065 [Actinomycetota bacterium]|nr:hypothetical protein [Actinomycetota bacterium]